MINNIPNDHPYMEDYWNPLPIEDEDPDDLAILDIEDDDE